MLTGVILIYFLLLCNADGMFILFQWVAVDEGVIHKCNVIAKKKKNPKKTMAQLSWINEQWNSDDGSVVRWSVSHLNTVCIWSAANEQLEQWPAMLSAGHLAVAYCVLLNTSMQLGQR